MALIECPDCQKQISDRATSCPHCGCPSEVWKSPITFPLDDKTNHFVACETDLGLSAIECDDLDFYDDDDEEISFYFEDICISYPPSTEIIADIYGEIFIKAAVLYEKYMQAYNNAGDIRKVLTTVAKEAQRDLIQVVDYASKYLYDCGIPITIKEFTNTFSVEIIDYIHSLYDQYNDLMDENDMLEYRREVHKATRSRWVGGGFGILGALKGAMTAAVLNAGSGLVNAVGDSFTRVGDRDYINKKYNSIYASEQNRRIFVNGIYECCINILDGIVSKLTEYNLIDPSIFDYEESLFDTAMKYERNKYKLFGIVLRCIKSAPHKMEYYYSILQELFELDCELEEFLEFWGFGSLYEQLETDYLQKSYGEIKNPFISNSCEFAIDINGMDEIEGKVKIKGKIIKGRVDEGDTIVLINSPCIPITSARIIRIEVDEDEVESAKIGRQYEFYLDLNYKIELNGCLMAVDEEAFERFEYDLYFICNDSSNEESNYVDFVSTHETKGTILQSINKDYYYCSSRGLTFSDSVDKIRKIYGEGVPFKVNLEVDAVYKTLVNNQLNDADVVAVANHGLIYSFGENYHLKLYFNNQDELILVIYTKDINVFSEVDAEGINYNNKNTNKVTWKVTCITCNKDMDKNSKFCNYCGEISFLYSKECPLCKKRIKKEVNFCNFCGNNKFD